jgi:Mce-associated membrane protein
MTGTLEVPIHPPADDGAAQELVDESPAAGTPRSKATVRTKSTKEASKSSRATPARAVSARRASSAASGAVVEKALRTRATASGKARGKDDGNGSVLSVQELAAQGPKESSAGDPEPGSTAVKAPRRRATTASDKRARASGNGSVLAARELEDASTNDTAATTEPPAVEPLVTQSADHEELEPSPPTAGTRKETKRRRGPSWVGLRSWVRSNLVLSGVAVALVVAVVLLTMTRLSLNSQDSLNSARTSALAAAQSYAVDLASYNYQHLDQDFGKVLDESTPTFKQNFSDSSSALSTTLKRYDASATAKVVAEGLVSATTSRAVVLVFLNQTVDNTLQKSKPTTESRVEITLLRSNGRWLIDQVSLL